MVPGGSSGGEQSDDQYTPATAGRETIRSAVAPVKAAAMLGLPALTQVLSRTEDAIVVTDADRRWVWANPAACRMLERRLDQLRGRDFLTAVPQREHATMLAQVAAQLRGTQGSYTGPLLRPNGTEREVVYSAFAIDLAGSPHTVTFFRDLTESRAATRTAVALAQTAAQLLGTATADEILAGIARHAVESTRAAACGMYLVDDKNNLNSAGGYEEEGESVARATNARWVLLGTGHGEAVIEAMTGGAVAIGQVPGKPVVLPEARAAWEANPITQPFARTLRHLDWQAGVYVPMAWENRVIGLLGVYLPSTVPRPSEAELAFYTALAGQAAVAIVHARLSAQAGKAAALLERSRLARELHDSVSQALFSMTMHARAAQLAMDDADRNEATPLGRSIDQLVELTKGTLAEMRALIFELRPETLTEEGLLGALRKTAATLATGQPAVIVVDGPGHSLDLDANVEEHLYRIASEALHNVIKHARATHVVVTITAETDLIRLTVSDDGVGFDVEADCVGHLGLSTMTQRASAVGAKLAIASQPGEGTIVTIAVAASVRGRRMAA
jgi:PAS domain S-box-containing protein